jgi:hypothetical protein
MHASVSAACCHILRIERAEALGYCQQCCYVTGAVKVAAPQEDCVGLEARWHGHCMDAPTSITAHLQEPTCEHTALPQPMQARH